MHLEVVTINWNGADDTIDCLKSILAADHTIDIGVTVIDNNSADGSVNQITTWAREMAVRLDVMNCSSERIVDQQPSSPRGQTTLIKADTNLGFCAANNLGANRAFERGADFVLILNNDTVVTSDFFRNIGPVLASDDGKTLYSPQISFYPQVDATWWNGGRFSSILGPAYIGQGDPIDEQGQLSETEWGLRVCHDRFSCCLQ